MATKLKIDPIELHKLLLEGKKTGELAKHFNCSPGAISQAKRKLGVAITRERASATIAAPVLIRNTDDAKREISTLITICNNQIQWIENTVVKKADETYRDWSQVLIKHVAEIRKLISELANIEYKLHHVEVVEKALIIMYQEIGNESTECQKRIRDRLEKAQILFHMDD